jgi:hypothetical protein
MGLSSPLILTRILVAEHGLQIRDRTQHLNNGITVYASDYFDPMDPRTIKFNSRIILNTHTYSIHWGAGSWVPRSYRILRIASLLSRRLLGEKTIDYLRGVLR